MVLTIKKYVISKSIMVIVQRTKTIILSFLVRKG